MTTTEPRITGFCPCCDKPMWADQYADRGFRVRSDAGVCNECPADGVAASRTVSTGTITGRSEQVVGHWATVQSSGVTMKAAAAELGLTYPAYWQAVQRARAAGDSRAEYLPRAGVNTRRESGPDWDRILSRWDRELRPAGLDYRQAAEAVGVPEKTFTNRLWAARNEGDPRAAKRVGARETAQRDTPSGRATVAGTEWVYTARGWEAPEDVETEGTVETVTTADWTEEQRRESELATRGSIVDVEGALYPNPDDHDEYYKGDPGYEAAQAEYEARRDQLTTWHADDQAAQAAGAAEVAL